MVRFIRNYSMEISLIGIFGFFALFIYSGMTWIIGFEKLIASIRPSVSTQVQNGVTIFLSIFIEGIPFILVGVLISSLIHTFVQEEHIWRFVPRHPVVSIPLASVMGLLLPICECGIVPVARRLMQKGLPTYVAITFLLAAPIVNPITIISTYLAFADQGMMVTLARTSLGAGVAISMGVLGWLLFRKQDVLQPEHQATSKCEHEGCEHDHDHNHHGENDSIWQRLGAALHHAIYEWMSMGKYFVLGVAIAAFFHTTIGLSALRHAIAEEWLSIMVLMLLAYVLSICSSADAFVAASFQSVIGFSPLLAFLVYGPMMDIKNVLMLIAAFRVRVVLFMVIGTTILTFFTVYLFF